MTKLAVRGPFDEGDLHDDLGTRPVNPQARQAFGFRERRRRNLEAIQSIAEVEQQLRVESRCRSCRRRRNRRRRNSRRAARPVRRVLPCGSVNPPTTSSCASLALHLQPVRRAPLLVGRVAPLGDDAFPALAAGPLPRLRIVERGDALERRLKRQSIEERAPLVERQRRDVAAVEPDDVEDVIVDRARAPTSLRRRGSASVAGRLAIASATAGRCCGSRLRENRRTSGPFLNASSRMPSNLRSKIHSGPVNRSCVRVAAMGRPMWEMVSPPSFATIASDPFWALGFGL